MQKLAELGHELQRPEADLLRDASTGARDSCAGKEGPPDRGLRRCIHFVARPSLSAARFSRLSNPVKGIDSPNSR